MISKYNEVPEASTSTRAASVLEDQTQKLVQLGQLIGKLTQQVYDLSVIAIGHAPPAPAMPAPQEPVVVPDSLIGASEYIERQVHELARTINRFY